jgi:hypothetical protein
VGVLELGPRFVFAEAHSHVAMPFVSFRQMTRARPAQ